MSEIKKPKIFISYSHKDTHWKNYIKKYFNKNSYDIWDDGRIKVGDNWLYKISNALYDCDIALLLLSVNFINSDFIMNKEVPILFDRYKKNKLLIVKIFLLPYPYEDIEWITKEGESLQGYIAPDKPLSKFIIENSYEGLEKSPDLGEYITKLVSEVKDAYNAFQNSLKKYNEKIHKLQDDFEKNYKIYSLDILKYNAKKLIDEIYWNKIEYAISHKDLIKQLNDINKADIFLEYLTEIFKNEKKIQKPITTELSIQSYYNNIFIHFRQDSLDENKYKVDIYARFKRVNLNKTYRDITIENIYSKECQKKFMKILHKIRKKNIPIHFIIPPELYLCSFRVWENTLKIIGLYHPIYLHSDTRFNQSIDDYEDMIEEEWNQQYFSESYISETLKFLSPSENQYDIRDKKIGICYKYIPTEKLIENHLEIAQIVLYPIKEKDLKKYQEWINNNSNKIKLKELPDKLQEYEYVSLVWDDMNMLINLKKELEQESKQPNPMKF